MSNDFAWLTLHGTTNDGASSNLIWCTLTNDVVTNSSFLRGGLHVDRTGVFGNELIAVTTGGVGDDRSVWRINAQRQPTLLTNITTLHLEGVVTLTNDAAKWGPWAGKILTGDEQRHLIFAIGANGEKTAYRTAEFIPGGIDPEDFDIIPPNQDLYCVDPGVPGANSGQIVKLSRGLLTHYEGDLLITQAGGETGIPPELFIVEWNGAEFVTRSLTYFHGDGNFGAFEHVSFAPMALSPLNP